jgi:hypothetical protein
MSISATKTDPAKFGDFTALCQRAALVVCPLLQNENGVEPNCYSRNVQLGSQLIFQPGQFSDIPHEVVRATVSDPIFLPIYSVMCGPYRGDLDDPYHDLPRSIEIHCSRTERDRHVLLHLHGDRAIGDIPG